MDPVPREPWAVTYADGCGNRTRFARVSQDASTFAYEPVKPETSSSGVYDGGEPVHGALLAAEIAALWTLIRRVEADPSLRCDTRRMGTGALHIADHRGERSVLVAEGAALEALDALVIGLRGERSP